jgi:shikimate kinase
MNEETRFPVEIRRIVLCGFMGAGKTTTGEILAARLGWPFRDVDHVIEKETGLKIAQIFAQSGEPYFRDHEYRTISRLLGEEKIILALGGGAVEHPSTREEILADPHTLFVHLAVALETVFSRCSGTETVRPVFNDRERLETRYNTRIPYYQQAHLTVATDDISAEEVADRLMKQIKHQIERILPEPWSERTER